ncbi:glycosyltransferase [Alphaproteobacteria bacterium]|nr:glycosyltransferase [Alphaproteobacteria bacterium]
MKALVLCCSNPDGDPRPERLIKWFIDKNISVDIVSYKSSGKLATDQQFKLKPLSQSFFSKFYRFLLLFASNIIALISKNPTYLLWIIESRYNLSKLNIPHKNYSIIVVEDLVLLPLAIGLKGKAKLIFDCREFYPGQNPNNLRFRLLEFPLRNYLCGEYLRLCDHIFTVSPSIAAEYMSLYGVKMEIFRSTPPFQKMVDQPAIKNQIKMVHHGMAAKNRNLGNLIEVSKHLGRNYPLDIYLVGDMSEIKKLRKKASLYEWIRILPPIKYDDIIPTLNQYDLGFCYFEPTTFNLKHCLPNKFFEYIQARVAVIVGPSPDMSDILNEFQCGFICEKFTINSVINTIEGIQYEQLKEKKLNAAMAAEKLCYEREIAKFWEIINEIY